MIANANQLRRTKRDPTPREIRRRCQEIQKGWSTRKRNNRRGESPKLWKPPVYSADEVPEHEGLDN